MLLYIVRHGDPIYEPDTLTEKGRMQAAALAKRLSVHGLQKIFTSPNGRARETAQPTCDLLGLPYTVEDWTSENHTWRDFAVPNQNGYLAWIFDVQNTKLRSEDVLPLGDRWYEADCFKAVDGKKGYERIVDCSDEFLARLGYVREGNVYRVSAANDDRVAVFCHWGFGSIWLSHLLAISPHIFWAGFSITHTGVTVIEFENHPDDYTAPRCLCLSDTAHLYKEELSLSRPSPAR